MALSDLYKAKQVITEKVEFKGESFDILLMTLDEMKVMSDLEVHVQLSLCIFENGKSLKDLGHTENLKNNMPLAHRKELMELISVTNGLDVRYEEIKKN